MAHLLSEALTRGMMPEYTGKLLAVFEAEKLRIRSARIQQIRPLLLLPPPSSLPHPLHLLGP